LQLDVGHAGHGKEHMAAKLLSLSDMEVHGVSKYITGNY
jgi:hypothetical protein